MDCGWCSRSNNGIKSFASLTRTDSPLYGLPAVHAGRYVKEDIVDAEEKE